MLKKILSWPFTTSPWEERMVANLNAWFGGVPGIKQVMLLVAMYIFWQQFAPPPLKFDLFPYVFLVLLITVVSLTSNQWLMNQTFQADKLDGRDKAALYKTAETTMHIAAAIVPILEQINETTEKIEDAVTSEVVTPVDSGHIDESM